MKKVWVLFFLPLVLACNLELPNNEGKIVIVNQTENEMAVITDVWIHGEGSTEWVSRWAGAVEEGYDVSIIVEPGSYDIRIRVNYLFYTRIYETGYKQPIAVGNKKVKYIIFDGNGIYDSDITQ